MMAKAAICHTGALRGSYQDGHVVGSHNELGKKPVATAVCLRALLPQGASSVRECCGVAPESVQEIMQGVVKVSQIKSTNGQMLVRASVAAILGTAVAASYAPYGYAADADGDKKDELTEIQITGSRIVRKDMSSNSPLTTVDRQKLEESSYVSLEETLNDMPQFMAGGVGTSAGVTTNLSTATGLDGGRGSGDMFNMSLLPDNAGVIGVVVPGAANVNLRGLGSNRSLVLIDGHRGMPLNASMTVDMNTIPSIAIGNVEVITGGASAVYGADALAGVTNIKFRDNFEGMNLRVKGGINAVGDGEEYQVSSLIGGKFGSDKGHVLVGLEYSKREVALWKNRSFLRDVMESPYSTSGDYLFAFDPVYNPAASSTGTFNPLTKTYSGNAPAATVSGNPNLGYLSVFSTRACSTATADCIADGTRAPRGGGYYFNADGTIYLRASQETVGTTTKYFGPQHYTLPNAGTPDSPNEVTCSYTSQGVYAGADARFAGQPCNPTTNRVDYGRWLTLPRDAYTGFGRATFEFNDHLKAYTNFYFASSNTETRREPAPFLGSGTYGPNIPFHTTQGGDAVYAPSVVTVSGSGLNVGDTKADYRPGGVKGTNCRPTGGCFMANVFRLPGDVFTADSTGAQSLTTSGELRRLLESRPGTPGSSTNVNISGTTSAFRGLSNCQQYTIVPAGTPGALVNATSGASYVITMDPLTGTAVNNCGANSPWAYGVTLPWLPPRGTKNTERLYQFEYGLKGDVGLSDWTWDVYASHGDAQTQTQYIGFASFMNFSKLMTAPSYGLNYRETGTGSKYLTCTSGLRPFDLSFVPSDDCVEAIVSNQVDRNSMIQSVYEATAQGHVVDLPAGEVRGSIGTSYRKNTYVFTPDSSRERDYIVDISPGQFGVGSINEAVSVKEAYGELLVPVLKDLPGIKSLELELGFRHSDYSSGQKVDTYKALASWTPVDWVRFRGGYNRAERAPNMSELYATPTGSSNLGTIPVDPCVNSTANATIFAAPQGGGATLNNTPTTDPVIRKKLIQLCSAQINAWGGANASDFHSTYDPNDLVSASKNTFNIASGGLLITGNKNLQNEKGDTWTIGVALRAPFEHALLRKITSTLDWYEVRVSNPIEVMPGQGQIVNSCFNINGLNPNYDLNDPLGYCQYIERNPQTGGFERILDSYVNQGKFVLRGLDWTLNWSGNLADMGLKNAPGSVSVNLGANYLIDQIQRYGALAFGDYAGFGGASRIRMNTNVGYNWGANRVSVNWQYRLGTQAPTNFSTTASADGSSSPTLKRNLLLAGYHTTNMYNLTAGHRFHGINASFSINNLFDTKPKPGGYDFRDPRHGFGSFSPYDDLVGRRFSFNVSMDF